MLRYWLIELPARAVDAAVRLYWLILAAGAVVALITAALWALLALLGYPLP
jgi:hypothetical protein